MFESPGTAPPTLSTTTSPASPSSPTRSSRLRGLNYLRSYTHAHLHSGSQSSPSTVAPASLVQVTRAQTAPVEVLRPNYIVQASELSGEQNISAPLEASSIQRSGSPGTTGGWLPSVGLRSSPSRVSTLPETTTRDTQVGGVKANDSASNSGSGDPMRTMTRSRADTAAPVVPVTRVAASQPPRTTSDPNTHEEAAPSKDNQLPTIRLSPHQDTRSNRPSLAFPSISRTLPSPASIIRVGRYSERDSTNGFLNEPNPGVPSHAPVGFKSKVVSRRHCEFWCQNAQWYIKDVGSSSGTFLNHIRLSQPGVESKPYVVNDGDVVQLGIDFRGGEEMIFRCVKIRVECNRGWQKGLNNFNKQTHKRLKNLTRTKPKVDGDNASTHTSECSICLMSIAPCQSLFVAPCSHVWHYKCIRPILNGHTWPNFLCPNCRAVADLEADVDEDDVSWSEEDDDEKDPDVRKAIEESLKESKDSDGQRQNATGEAMRSLDVTEARSQAEDGRAISVGSRPELDRVASGTASSRASSAGSRGRVGYGQGSESTDNLRSRAQRSVRSTASTSSGRNADQSSRQETSSAGDAELAALVAQNMHIGAPSRTPPPPPKDKQVSDGSTLRRPGIPTNGIDSTPSPQNSSFWRGTSQRAASNPPPFLSPVSPLTPSVTRYIDGTLEDDGIVSDEDVEETRTDSSKAIAITPNRDGSSRLGRARENAPLSLRQNSNDLNTREMGGPEGPMTPRNDAGPFILDGSGGR